MAWWALWWAWLGIGLALAILEIVVPAYIFLGFALGAALMGIGLGLGVFSIASLPWALVIFAVLSLLGYVVMRKVFGAPGGSVKIWNRDINED